MIDAVAIRPARTDDWPRLAALHAASWRATYRGLLPDHFLDHEVGDERAGHWRELMHAPGAAQRGVFIAERKGTALGFAFVALDVETQLGAFLDNLHLAPGMTGQGIGRRLLGVAARWAATERPGIALHLILLDGNAAAARFYERLGAMRGERFLKQRAEGPVPFIRYRWPSAAALASALGC